MLDVLIIEFERFEALYDLRNNPNFGGSRMANVKILYEDQEIVSSFPIMQQLRSELERETPETYLQRVRRMEQNHHYRLVAVFDQDEIRVLAGYRIAENFVWGKYLYVNELITDREHRRKGYGQKLFDWLLCEAKAQRCRKFRMDTTVQQHVAHRFCLKNKLYISCHHFQLNLD